MWQTFLNSVQSVMILLLLTATGYFCAWKGWFSKDAKSFLSKFIMQLAVPFMCMYSLRSRLDIQMLKEAGPMLLAPFLCISSTFLLAYLAAKILKIERRSFGPFMMMCGLSNTLLIGFPMCTELFGPDCTSYVIMYYMVSTCFTQSLGMGLIRWSGESGKTVTPWQMAKKIITTPTIIGVILGLTIVITDFQPPALFMSYGKYMNQVVTPIAMLITGKIIYDIGLKNLRVDFIMWLVMAFRFLISPGLCLLFCKFFGISGMALDVFIVQAAMPVVSQTSVAAAEYGADEEIAAQGAALSTILSFAVIPVLMLLLS